jgi:DNA-binding GntR family transcriptional regulator
MIKIPSTEGEHVTRRQTVSRQVYYRIRDMIVRRELLPGSPLVLRELAGKLNVSRMPVVEAIRRLERDGFVVDIPKWGASVREWTREERLEAYCIRRALEGEAARFFVMRATEEDKRKLVELNNRFDSVADVDPVACDEADVEFHLHIAMCTRFSRLCELIENAKIETATIFGLSLVSLHAAGKNASLPSKAALGCHKPVVKALLGSDPEIATRAIWKHIDSVMERILEFEGEETPRRSVASRSMAG